MWRLSLRELLVLVALVALAIVSLKYASESWVAIVAAVTMLAFFVATIVAAVDRGPRQAFAIGFALTMAGYAMIVMNSTINMHNGGTKKIEFDQWEGRLPTTRLLRYLHMAVEDNKWIDFQTGKEIPDYDPNNPPASVTATPVKGAGARGLMLGARVSFVESPPSEVFMPIGHCWWGLLLGYLGGLLAAFVYHRRMRDQTPS